MPETVVESENNMYNHNEKCVRLVRLIGHNVTNENRTHLSNLF